MASERTVIRRLTATYVMALCLIGLLSGTMHWMLAEVIDRQSDSAAVINVAGRQRMLSQRIAYLARDLLAENSPATVRALRDAIDLMARSNRALMQGDPTMGIGGDVIARQQITLYSKAGTNLTASVDTFLAAARKVADAGLDPDVREAAYRDVHDAALSPLLTALDDATREVAMKSAARIVTLRDAQNISLAVLLLTLACEAFLVFRPLILRIKTYVERLYSAATTDTLTGLANPHHFIETADASARALAARSFPSAVLKADIDKFDLIADRFGREACDQALAWFATTLRETARKDDVVAHLGTGAFAVFLPGNDLDQAGTWAERLRLAVENGMPPNNVPKFTVSIGVAPLLPNEIAIDDALKSADDALYAAKIDGRNRVVRMPRAADAIA